MKRVVMYQHWHHLLFLHWKANQDEMRKWVPDELEIDTFDGDAYFGLVLFTMRGVRPRFVPPMPSLPNASPARTIRRACHRLR